MMWLISLILLAVAAYFLISALTGKNKYETEVEAAQIADEASSSDTSSNEAFQHAGGAPAGVIDGNSITDIQEMLKALNLRDSDSGRLAIAKDQFADLKNGSSNLSADELSAVADKLRWMLR